MSKRAERKAIEMYPITAENGERAFLARGFFVKGYEQGEKETIDRAAEWLEKSLQFGVHPCSGASFIEQFKREMEEDNG